MLARAIAIALCLSAAPLPAFAVEPVMATEQAATMSTRELMQATALDRIFTTFAETIASSPELQGVPMPPPFLAAWKDTALEVLDADTLHAELEAALDGKLTDAENAEVAAFFRSDFGKRITALEVDVQMMEAEEQLAARDTGIAILEDIPADATRSKQIDEIMTLVSADVARAMLGQAMRAMLVSMSLSGASGDIEVPWEEIDRQLADLMPGFEQEMLATQRALMAYAYQSLADDEVENYLTFLRTDASQRFYALIGLSVGKVMEGAMARFGEELAHRLNRVNV